jgi:hypothetical protein
LSRDSAFHRAKRVGDELIISPIDENDAESLRRFTRIVRKAKMSGRTFTRTHKSSRFSGELYDVVHIAIEE